MNSELEVLLDVVARLEGAGIAYMLTGSVAMSLYAEPRMTRDIDLVVELAGCEAAHVAELFAPDYYVEEEAVRAAIASRGLVNLFHLEQLVKVDPIVRKDDEFRRHEFARRSRLSVGSRSAWVVAKEDLILAKLAWAAGGDSALQLRDVRNLLASGVDQDYLSTGAGGSVWRRFSSAAWMKDTTPEFARFVADRYRRLSPAERLRLCTEMFDAARALVEASLPPGLPEGERRRRIVARFYGEAFAARVRARIGERSATR